MSLRAAAGRAPAAEAPCPSPALQDCVSHCFKLRNARPARRRPVVKDRVGDLMSVGRSAGWPGAAPALGCSDVGAGAGGGAGVVAAGFVAPPLPGQVWIWRAWAGGHPSALPVAGP